MLKNIIIKTANLVGRSDIAKEVGSATTIASITNTDLKNDVSKIVGYYNFVVESTFCSYLDLEHSESLTSNYDSKILYTSFSKRVIDILSVEDAEGNSRGFMEKTDCIVVPAPSTTYKVCYKYLPAEATELVSETTYLTALLENIICYAVASKFLSSVGKFAEAEEFKNQFLDEIFMLKTKKERRLKSTFCL